MTRGQQGRAADGEGLEASLFDQARGKGIVSKRGDEWPLGAERLSERLSSHVDTLDVSGA